MTLKMKQTQKHKRLLIAGGVLAVMALCAAAWFGFTAMGNAQLEADSALEKPGSSCESVEKVTVTDDELSQLIKGDITLDSVLHRMKRAALKRRNKLPGRSRRHLRSIRLLPAKQSISLKQKAAPRKHNRLRLRLRLRQASPHLQDTKKNSRH